MLPLVLVRPTWFWTFPLPPNYPSRGAFPPTFMTDLRWVRLLLYRKQQTLYRALTTLVRTRRTVPPVLVVVNHTGVCDAHMRAG